jgi:hypothetical protein
MTAVRRSDGDVDPLAVLPAFPEERVHAVHVGPLALDDIERVVLETVGEGFPRTTLSRIHEMSGGNPFFAQEIALALLRRGDEVGRASGSRSPTACRSSSNTAWRDCRGKP